MTTRVPYITPRRTVKAGREVEGGIAPIVTW